MGTRASLPSASACCIMEWMPTGKKVSLKVVLRREAGGRTWMHLAPFFPSRLSPHIHAPFLILFVGFDGVLEGVPDHNVAHDRPEYGEL